MAHGIYRSAILNPGIGKSGSEQTDGGRRPQAEMLGSSPRQSLPEVYMPIRKDIPSVVTITIRN
jgi:hypothetical protein